MGRAAQPCTYLIAHGRHDKAGEECGGLRERRGRSGHVGHLHDRGSKRVILGGQVQDVSTAE